MAKKGRAGVAEPTANTTVPSRDVLQRLSYLYQASVLLASVLPRPPPRPPATEALGASSEGFLIPTQAGAVSESSRASREAEEDRMEVDASKETSAVDGASEGENAEQEAQKTKEDTPRKKRKHQETAARPVSRVLAKTIGDIAKKATVRIDPSVKRTICKGCSTVLVSGVTSTVRVKPSGPHAHMLVYTCLSCRTLRRIPAPPHLPPDIEEALREERQDIVAMEDDASVDDEVVKARKRTKREKREARQARRPIFFERSGHVTFAGTKRVENAE